MIYTVTKDVATDINVSLLDSSNVSVVGVVFSAVTVQLRKQGGSLNTKIISSGEWNELGDGIYKLSLNVNDLNTEGFLRVVVSGATWETYRLDIQVLDDFLSIAQQIIDIKEQLATKVNINDADTLFAQLENRERVLEEEIEELEERLQRALAALAAKS